MELLRDLAQKLYSPQFIDPAGVAADADDPPTVEIVRDSDGSAVTAGSVSSVETGRYAATVTVDDVDLLRSTWSGEVDGDAGTLAGVDEVVGGFLCSLEDITALE